MSDDELLDRWALKVAKETKWCKDGEELIARLLFQILRELRQPKEAKKK